MYGSVVFLAILALDSGRLEAATVTTYVDCSLIDKLFQAYGDDPEKSSGLYCGFIPDSILSCINNPKIINPEVSATCDKSTISECAKMNCIFRESNWLDGSKVDKQKVSAYFDQFAKDHPEWSKTVGHVKTYCLDKDLPAQGVLVNCPAYDIVHCVFSVFIKTASRSQWSTEKECAYPKQYAARCPICPNSCFAPQIPIGSCSSCLLTPR